MLILIFLFSFINIFYSQKQPTILNYCYVGNVNNKYKKISEQQQKAPIYFSNKNYPEKFEIIPQIQKKINANPYLKKQFEFFIPDVSLINDHNLYLINEGALIKKNYCEETNLHFDIQFLNVKFLNEFNENEEKYFLIKYNYQYIINKFYNSNKNCVNFSNMITEYKSNSFFLENIIKKTEIYPLDENNQYETKTLLDVFQKLFNKKNKRVAKSKIIYYSI
jgi:hypothetical protein